MKIDTKAAIAFLKFIRPKGPWPLTSIYPDAGTTTRTLEATDEAGVAAWIKAETKAGKNIYFTGASCGRPTSKPKKEDVSGVVFLHSDNDPEPGESIEDAKLRIFQALTAHSPPPSVINDSGNGLQAIWMLDHEHVFPSVPAGLTDAQRKAQIARNVAPVEERNVALAKATGAGQGTHNCDRLLRLPGTINYPNKTKRAAGRIQCETSTLTMSADRYAFASFPRAKAKPGPTPPPADGDDEDEADSDKVAELIKTGDAKDYDGDRSKALFAVLCHLVRRGLCRKRIAKIVLNIPGDIAAHIAEQPGGSPEAVIERQVARAVERIDFAINPETKKPAKTIRNIRIALAKLGVTLRYDQFALAEEIEGLKGFGPHLDDAALNRLRVALDQRFQLKPTMDMFMLTVNDTCRVNSFHPIKDYLSGLKWDGVPRVDAWLIRYGGAEDSPYTRAVSALPLLAAVRRIRQPGVKFDEMLVLEGNQGSGRSSAIRTLAVRDEWFLDNAPFGLDDQKVIERLSGKWIVEAAELSGMRKADVEHLKAYLSSPGESARPAYGRKKMEAPRQNVFIGTTNETNYLRDETGNRRFWGVKLSAKFKIEDLARDRDQLWAEAVARERQGESIRLDESLWPVATEQQKARMVADPFDDILADALGDREGKILSLAVWAILNIPETQRTSAMLARASHAMQRLGWERAENPVTVGGKKGRGYLKGKGKTVGDKTYHLPISALRTHYGRDLMTAFGEEAPKKKRRKRIQKDVSEEDKKEPGSMNF